MIPVSIFVIALVTFLFNIGKVGVDTEKEAGALVYSLLAGAAMAAVVLYVNGGIS